MDAVDEGKPRQGSESAATARAARLGALADSVRARIDAEVVAVAVAFPPAAGGSVRDLAAEGHLFVIAVSSAAVDGTASSEVLGDEVLGDEVLGDGGPGGGVPGSGALSVGALIPASPFIQAVLASPSPLVAPREPRPDIVDEAFFLGRGALCGVRLEAEGAAVGALLAASRAPLVGLTSEATRATLDELAGALGHLAPRDLSEIAPYRDVPELLRELHESEGRYRRLISSTSEAIWHLEPEHPISTTEPIEIARALAGARFIEANATFARRFGFTSPDSLIGTRAADLDGFWLLDDVDRLAELAASAFSVRDLQVTESCPGAAPRVLASSLFGVHAMSGLRSVWAIERDITAQVDEDRVLRESAEFYKAISQTALDGICVLSADLEVLDCNDAFLDLLDATPGRSRVPEEVPLRSRSDGVDTREWFEAMAAAGSWRGEARLLTRDRGMLPVELACRVTEFGPRRYYCFILDISERLAAKQRESEHHHELAHAARLSTLGEMTSGLAHELNQPLAAIVNYANGCVRLLDQPDFDRETVSNALRAIAEQSDRAATIIRRMRTFARRESDKREALRLSELLLEAVELFKPTLIGAGVSVETDFDLADDEVIVDGIQIQQVALNLFRNAMDAFARSPRLEGRRIEIATSEAPTPKVSDAARFVQVAITDSGPGIPEASAGRIFDPFFSAGADGVGLGLTVSRSIIETHGGRLWLDQGSPATRFCFTIPLRNAPIQA